MAIIHDLVFIQRLQKHVVKELTGIGGQPKGDHFLILCPFHDDSKPSLRVNVGDEVLPGVYHCFSCGSSGSWNRLADALKLVPYEKEKLSEIKEKDNIFRLMSKTLLTMKDKLEETPDTLRGIEDIPVGFTWRGYDKSFLDFFKAKLWWDRARDLNYLYFPLTMNSQYVGYTLCNLDRDRSNIKYLLFTDAKKTFFLYDFIPSMCPIVLVEGHTDALRLFRSGIPALALFGVENWGTLKKSFLMAKVPKKVWIMMDGDEAGYRAAQKIFMDLRGGCDVDLIPLPIQTPKMDPDSIPQEWIEEIKAKIGL